LSLRCNRAKLIYRKKGREKKEAFREIGRRSGIFKPSCGAISEARTP
jgi:hypothetical protein